MKRTLKTALCALTGLTLGLAALAYSSVWAAGTATMSLSPASASVIQGNILAVDVYEDSGTDLVNSVQANLNYPASLLNFVSISQSAAFDFSVQATGGGGSVKIGRGATTPVSGRQLVATVRFTAITSSGTANITFDNSTSGVARADGSGAEALTTTPGSYTLTAPPATPPPATPPTTPPASGGGSSAPTKKPSTPSSTPSSSAPNTPGSSPTVVTDKTAPTITELGVSNLSGSTATVHWKTSELASSEVDYGLDAKYGASVVENTLTKDHSLALNSKYILAGKLYHYLVKSVDSAGNQAVSKDATFRTLGAGSTTATPKKTNSRPLVVAAVTIAAIAIAAGAGAVAFNLRRRLLTPGTGAAGPVDPPNTTIVSPNSQLIETQNTPAPPAGSNLDDKNPKTG